MTSEELEISRSTPLCRFDGPTPAARPAEVAKPVAVPVNAAAEQHVADLVRDEPVVLFALEWCEFCWSVRKLFARLDIAYRSIDLDSVAYQAEDLGGRIRAVLANRTGSPTIPQIFIGGRHIGGCTDLFDAWRAGSIQRLLTEKGIAYRKTSISIRIRCCRNGCSRARAREEKLMTFIDTIDDRDLDAEVRAMYDRQQAHYGFVPNYARGSATGRTSWRSGRRCRTASGARWTSGGSSSSRSPPHTRSRAPCARSRMAGCSVNSSRRRTCSRLAGARSHRR